MEPDKPAGCLNPTPKLTAELKESLSVLFERPITDDDVVGLRLLGVIESRVATATRKAFEEAAEMAQRKADGIACANPRNRAVARALLDFADELYALAKEKGG